MTALELTRKHLLGHRRRVGAIEERLPPGPTSLRRAAWAGLTDSMPRAAQLSIHARVADTRPTGWEDPSLVQVWGPRFSAYVVPAADHWVFSLGRLPDDPAGIRRADGLADRLEAFLEGRRMAYGAAGRAIGVHPNELRYAAATGRLLLRWEGARQPVVWTVPRPNADPEAARFELARRYLTVLGPGTAEGFGRWAGIGPSRARRIFDALRPSLIPVATPIGDGWILSSDEPSFRAEPDTPALARLLPSGDAYYLLQGRDRELLVPEARLRPTLWTPRVWPGALLVNGEIAGIWRREQADVTIEPWRSLAPSERAAVETEAVSLPIPGVERGIRVGWGGELAD
ncbi:MAG TPA: crosslink repair DNA glycosylase YcaQ family protein [Chloroflexota bacterium]|nr:crosslink repair DNA glycosylase YcaQ family protein [Chloroflexota bacterium]